MQPEKQPQVEEPKSEQKVRLMLEETHLLTLEKTECEQLGEIKLVLLENPFIKLHPNIKFQYKNKDLKEFDSLSAQISDDLATLDIKLAFSSFNQRTAGQHVMALSLFFENPENFIYEHFLEFNTLLGHTDYVQTAFQGQQLQLPEDFAQQDLLQGNLSLVPKFTFFKQNSETEENFFFKELSYSKFNPPLGQGKHQGDLLYLDFISQENTYYCVTVNKNGCFINSSKKDQFNSKPSSQTYPHLLKLFSHISPFFDKCLIGYYDPFNDQLYKNYSQQFKLTMRNTSPSKWLQEVSSFDRRITCLRNLREILKTEIFGQNFVFYRDWNEEFQNCKVVSGDDKMNQFQKMKILRKSQNDFLQASEKLSKAVVEEELIPLNPSENKVENCYVYNNLFATYACESLDWELPKSEVSPSTFSTINNDLRNLRTLFELDVQDINTINTCTVDYLGHRVIIQTVIQGILHFDQKTWNCYGSIDDGKTMNWNQSFHDMMKGICEKFNVSLDNLYYDEKQKEYCFHGSPEVKGIKAGDGRYYIMDLMRLSPRDVNFPDKTKHECCVLRPEVIKSFIFYQNIQKAYERNQAIQEQKVKEEQKKKQEKEENENQKGNNQEKGEENEQQKKEIKEVIQTKQEEIKQEKKEQRNQSSLKIELDENSQQNVQDSKQKKKEDTVNQEQNEVKQGEKTTHEESLEKQSQKKSLIQSFNPSLYTQLESRDAKTEKQKKDLEEIAKFLKNNVISVYLNNIHQNPMLMPVDMEGLTDSLHKNGINLRYLGYIYEQVCKTSNFYLKKLIERTVFVRAFTKVLRKVALQNNKETLLAIFVRFLNLFLGDQEVKEKLDGSQLVTNQSQNRQRGDKKKKNKKKKKKKNKTKIPELNVFKNQKEMQMTSLELLNSILHIVEKRYSFPILSIKSYQHLGFLKCNQDKNTFLRELCLNFGIKLRPKKYFFSFNPETKQLPFSIADISGYFSKIKGANYFENLLQYNSKQIENEIYNKNFQGAFQMLQASLNMIVSTQGIYNKEFLFAISKMANILFQLKQVDKAIQMQMFVVQLSELHYGIDHFNTAFSILELSNFMFEKKQVENSMKLHSLALFIFDLIGSVYNPNSLFCLHELQALYTQKQNKEVSELLLEQLLDRNAHLFGQTSERILYFLDKLASLKADKENYEKASLLQARHSLILGRVLKKRNINDQYQQQLQAKLQQSEQTQKIYMSKRNKN